MFRISHREAYVSPDSKNIAMLSWIGCLFTLFLLPFVLYMFKADDDYVGKHAKEGLNWSITLTAIVVVITPIGALLEFISESLVLIYVAALVLLTFLHIMFCVRGAISSYQGKDFKLFYIIKIFQ